MTVPRRRRTIKSRIFLSHASQNRRFATGISTVLRAHGLDVWYSESHLVGAQQWHDEIGLALSQCDWFALILSPASVKSQWVKRELVYALQQPRYEGRIIPILYQPCDTATLSWTLGGFQTINFIGNQSDGFSNLLRIWRLTYDAKLTSA